VTFDILALAEGAVNDARGALTLVGVNQRVLAPSALPFMIKQRLVLILSDEIPGSTGDFGHVPGGTISIQVLDPTGSITFSANEEIKVQANKRWLDLPLVVNLIMEVDINGNSWGVYVIEVKYTPTDSDELMHRLPLYVVNPNVVLSAEAEPGRAFDNQQVGSTSLPPSSS
jgi:hypothetical protein